HEPGDPDTPAIASETASTAPVDSQAAILAFESEGERVVPPEAFAAVDAVVLPPPVIRQEAVAAASRSWKRTLPMVGAALGRAAGGFVRPRAPPGAPAPGGPPPAAAGPPEPAPAPADRAARAAAGGAKAGGRDTGCHVGDLHAPDGHIPECGQGDAG